MAKKIKAEKATGMVQIQTKVPGYNGVSAGIQFRDGVGETNDEWRIQWFKDHDYSVGADNTDAVDPAVDEDKTPNEGESDE